MPDKYSSGKIYKLVGAGILECYVGSTCSSLKKRLYQHNYAYENKEKMVQYSSSKLYDLSKNISIQLIEDFPCDSKAELLVRERYWIENTLNCINKNTPILNAEEVKERGNVLCLKNYYEDRENRLQKHKEWLEENKERIAKERATPENRAKEREAQKKRMEDPEYANAYKEKRSLAKKEKVICPICQKQMNKNSLADHVKLH